MADLLLDTCAVIWIGLQQPIARSAEAAIKSAALDGSVAVSPFTGWELGMLVTRGRLVLGVRVDTWFDSFMARPGMKLAPLSTDILIAAHALPGSPPNDPADRIIIATARAHNLAIVTRDRRILDYGAAGHVQTALC